MHSLSSRPVAKRWFLSFRAFYTITLLLVVLAIASVVADQAARYRLEAQYGIVKGQVSRNLGVNPMLKRDEECRLVHRANDKCAFIKVNCLDQEAGILSYLSLYYCTLPNVQPVAFIIIVLWLSLLFSTLGIAAGDFFSVNLGTIATILGMSQSTAGVTFLALGNGSADIFSTFTAVNMHSGSLAVGELIGAAGFITAVVAGCVALVGEFKVEKETLTRDIAFFIVAICLTMVFLQDGQLDLWESCAMIGFYMFYVATVIIWHWYLPQGMKLREKKALASSHPFASNFEETEDQEDYFNNEETLPGTQQGLRSAEDLGGLARGQCRGRERHSQDACKGDSEQSNILDIEMGDIIRLESPQEKDKPTSSNFIWSKLLEILDFLSIPSSLQESKSSGTLRIRPGQYLHPSKSEQQGAESEASPDTSDDVECMIVSNADGAVDEASQRLLADERAYASHSQQWNLNDFSVLPNFGDSSSKQARSSIVSFSDFMVSPQSNVPQNSNAPLLSPDTLPYLPQTYEHDGIKLSLHKYGNWWSCRLLPFLRLMAPLLFPAISDWKNKSRLGKILAVVSTPSIFLLSVTIPVVEVKAKVDDTAELDFLSSESLSLPRMLQDIPPVQTGQHHCEKYRANALTHGRTPIFTMLPTIEECDGHGNIGDVSTSSEDDCSRIHPEVLQLNQVAEGRDLANLIDVSNSSSSWNRWLVTVQIFTIPLFMITITKAKSPEDTGSMSLLRLVLFSLLGSLAASAILLFTTTPDTVPRCRPLLSFLGFVVSIAWISTIANEVVGVLKAFGVIFGISDALLGLTVFAVGNSLGDLIADVKVARMGYPVMALSACFGGPMMNILLGIGVSGLYMTIKEGRGNHANHPDKPFSYPAFQIKVGSTLIISSVTLLITLLGLLVAIPLNKWVMGRKISWCLIVLWSFNTGINVIVGLMKSSRVS